MNAVDRAYADADEPRTSAQTIVGMVAVVPPKPLREVAKLFPFAAACIDGNAQAVRYADEAIRCAGSDWSGHLDGTIFSRLAELKELARDVRRYLFARSADFGSAQPIPRTSRFD
jgi:hypothetical protein